MMPGTVSVSLIFHMLLSDKGLCSVGEKEKDSKENVEGEEEDEDEDQNNNNPA